MLSNCTVYNVTTDGVLKTSTGGIMNVTNTISLNPGGSYNSFADDSGLSEMTQSYNISSDGSASGVGSLTNRTATASSSPGAGDWVVFYNITNGTEDLHLQTSSENDALGAGTDLSADSNLAFNNDIEGDERNFNDRLGDWCR